MQGGAVALPLLCSILHPKFSRRTLYRRLNEWNLPIDIKYSTITDENLDSLVADIKRSYPTYGEVLLRSHLHTLGVNIQRSRLRACIHRIDPYTIELRRRETVRRRVYSVESPNSLWHIDGYHKLIRWKLVVHGGIDGKTRTIVFLNCSPNNCASSVFHHFQSAVAIYGIPDRVRSDKGGENIDVWRYMYHFHGNAAAAIAGSSTHNERIERLWRDVYRCVSSNYYELFYHMEEQQKLDPLKRIYTVSTSSTFKGSIKTFKISVKVGITIPCPPSKIKHLIIIASWTAK